MIFLYDEFNVYKKQPKKLWQTIKSLNMSSPVFTKLSSFRLNINNDSCFEVDHLPPDKGKYGLDHIHNFYQSIHAPMTSFRLREVSCIRLRISQNLNSSKATDLDQLSPRFIKVGADVIMSSLTQIKKRYKICKSDFYFKKIQ